jgi:hypothetical protein
MVRRVRVISAEQARKNVEQYNAQVAEAKRQAAATYVEKAIEPRILEASMQGKRDIVIDVTQCMDVISEVLGIIHEAGFKTERNRSDSAIQITWYGGAEATPHNSAKAVVVIR